MTVRCVRCGRAIRVASGHVAGKRVRVSCTHCGYIRMVVISDEPPAAQRSPVSSAWHVGAIVDGKYEITAELGRGGRGIVHKVHHLEWDVDMAVKTPLPHLNSDEDLMKRFVREAGTWVDLGLHPHIVQCWYVREIGGVPRIFMEFVDGGNLKDLGASGRVAKGDWGLILDLTMQACDGLGYAHKKGVVHRDVKPANMLVTDDGRLCITDFGIAKPIDTVEIWLKSSDPAVGHRMYHLISTELGTPEYVAPEQWGNLGRADARADIYAMGVVLFELCCARRPFDDGTGEEPRSVIIGRHFEMPAPDPRTINPAVPADLAEIVLRCLMKAPESRPQSMRTLRDELAAVYAKTVGRAYSRPVPVPA